MALSADEQKLLEELTRRSQEPDADDDFEVEIFNGNRGARLPFSAAKEWLASELGVTLPSAKPPEGDGGQGGGQPGDGGQGGTDGGTGDVRKYFRGKQGAKTQ